MTTNFEALQLDSPEIPEPSDELGDEYKKALEELASSQGMSRRNALRATIRLYQAERNGLVVIAHLDDVHPVLPEEAQPEPAQPVNRRLLEALRECLFYLNDNLGSLEASLAAKRGEAVIAEAEAQPEPAQPVGREPLSRQTLIGLWGDKSDGPSNSEIVDFGRAVERAHGITGEGV